MLTKSEVLATADLCEWVYDWKNPIPITAGVEVYRKKTLSTEVTLSILGDVAFVVFRGSKGLIDWIYDFRVMAASVSSPFWRRKIRPHRGFYMSGRRVYPDLVGELLGCSPKKVVITGHSKGGGEASVLSGGLEALFEAAGNALPVFTVTYGAPRCWFLRRCSRALRFVFFEDPVPEVPKFYKHPFGDVVFFGRDKDYLNPSRHQVRREQGRLSLRGSNHNMSLYKARLGKCSVLGAVTLD